MFNLPSIWIAAMEFRRGFSLPHAPGQARSRLSHSRQLTGGSSRAGAASKLGARVGKPRNLIAIWVFCSVLFVAFIAASNLNAIKQPFDQASLHQVELKRTQ